MTRARFIYVLPALLCLLAMSFGIIPSVFCLDGKPFAWLSVAVFIISLLLHGYILLQWRRYADHSPLAYALVQPFNHLIILCFALAVGATSMCAKPPASGQPPPLVDYNLPRIPLP